MSRYIEIAHRRHPVGPAVVSETVAPRVAHVTGRLRKIPILSTILPLRSVTTAQPWMAAL